MGEPKRIQRSRVKGYRLPEGAVVVSRPSRYGNPWALGGPLVGTRPDGSAWEIEDVLRWYRRWMLAGLDMYPDYLAPLRGHDLACWCPTCPAHRDGLPLGVTCAACAPCHATTLLELANR